MSFAEGAPKICGGPTRESPATLNAGLEAHAREERGKRDGDAAARPVEQDRVREDASLRSDERHEGNVPEAVGEGVERREGRGEVRLEHTPGARDAEDAELCGAADERTVYERARRRTEPEPMHFSSSRAFASLSESPDEMM